MRSVVVVVALMSACSKESGSTEAHLLQVDGYCLSSKSRIDFQVLLAMDYTKTSMGPTKSREIYSLRCERESKLCSGIKVDLDRVDEGKPMGFFDLLQVEGAEIVANVGDIFTVQWGPFRTFTVDLGRGAVTLLESNDSTYGRGESPCKVSKKTD